jgi:chromosomal replication initiation ATPase DnaA
LRLADDRPPLAKLALSVCRVHGGSVAALRSGSRWRAITEPRRVLCWLAVKELGYSGAEVARLYRGDDIVCQQSGVGW